MYNIGFLDGLIDRLDIQIGRQVDGDREKAKSIPGIQQKHILPLHPL